MGKYLDIIKRVEAAHKEPQEHPEIVKESLCPVPIPGCRIVWQGADMKERGPAVVDFLHTDPDGSVWAFVTVGEGWAAVNLKYARMLSESNNGKEQV